MTTATPSTTRPASPSRWTASGEHPRHDPTPRARRTPPPHAADPECLLPKLTAHEGRDPTSNLASWGPRCCCRSSRSSPWAPSARRFAGFNRRSSGTRGSASTAVQRCMWPEAGNRRVNARHQPGQERLPRLRDDPRRVRCRALLGGCPGPSGRLHRTAVHRPGPHGGVCAADHHRPQPEPHHEPRLLRHRRRHDRARYARGRLRRVARHLRVPGHGDPPSSDHGRHREARIAGPAGLRWAERERGFSGVILLGRLAHGALSGNGGEGP